MAAVYYRVTISRRCDDAPTGDGGQPAAPAAGKPAELHVAWPPRCACCMSTDDLAGVATVVQDARRDQRHGGRTVRVTWTFHVPFCQACIRHLNRWAALEGSERNQYIVAGLAAIGLGAAIACFGTPLRSSSVLDAGVCIMLGGTLLTASYWLVGKRLRLNRWLAQCNRLSTPGCTDLSSPVTLARGCEGGGAMTFLFSNRSYAAAFAAANASDPELALAGSA